MGSVPASGRFPWRRAWQPTPVFLPREPHGQRSLVGYSSWCYKRVRHNLATNQQQKQHKWLEVLLEFCRKFLIYSKPQTFLFLKPTHTYTHTPPHINCCCHVAQLCLTLCNPVDCRTPGRLPCPSPSPRVRFNSSLLSQWCHPTILSSMVPFSSCLQSFPASASFPMSQLFASGGQSLGASASASVLPMNIQDWFPLGLTGLISLESKRLSRVFSNTTVQNHQFFNAHPTPWSNSHTHKWLLEKP